MTNLTYFMHADDFHLFEHWSATRKVIQPIPIAELTLSDYEDDKHNLFISENPQTALAYYLENSEVLALTGGDTSTDRIWCEYRGYVWLFAVIEATAPYDSTSNDYTFATRCHWNGQWIDNIDKLLEDAA